MNQFPVPGNGEFVLYWMTAFRRGQYNFALQRAVELANQFNRPLLVFEPLRLGYRWACERFHRFLLDGMVDNGEVLKRPGCLYLPFVEKAVGEAEPVFRQLCERSAAVVTDDYPGFFNPAAVRGGNRRIKAPLEAVDSNGLLPLRAVPKVFTRAHFFRSFLHKNLHDHFFERPEKDPLSGLKVAAWPAESGREIASIAEATREVSLSQLPIDQRIRAVLPGGAKEAESRLDRFLEARLGAYCDKRNHPGEKATSGLSGHVHFGHLSTHQIFERVIEMEGWHPGKRVEKYTGKNEGWWGLSPNAEAFLDQVLTWRELGFNMAWQDRSYTRYRSLPNWAQKTLDEHRDDPREHVYSLEEFENSGTHDPLWNAAQNQLRQEGMIHNYLRMLWGKKILQWSEAPEEALRIMVELNNRYAIDGRDPNSYSGIFWIMGRYDRAWGPERKVFGKVRYMASENTARKFNVKGYLEKYTPT
ncbi:MAG: deoxyribodipyrimidine photolyase [Planctomycetota bacterium]|nr:deoxyribodipyrimidine photolyase [Planctomycetota bacterium]